MGDVGYHIAGLPEHPLIAPGDCEAWVNGFDAFREHGIREIAGIKLVVFGRGRIIRAAEKQERSTVSVAWISPAAQGTGS